LRHDVPNASSEQAIALNSAVRGFGELLRGDRGEGQGQGW
jgi:hypothetical protein